MPEPPSLEEEDPDGMRVGQELGEAVVETVSALQARAVNVRRRAEFVEQYFGT